MNNTISKSVPKLTTPLSQCKATLSYVMGGKAAKERRRLQRESLQIENGSPSSVVNKTRALPRKGRPTVASQKFKRSPFPQKTKAEKAKKIKKPKHLKRKLETIEDDAERSKLLIALEAWDETKAKRSKQPNKKPRVEISSDTFKSDDTENSATTQKPAQKSAEIQRAAIPLLLPHPNVGDEVKQRKQPYSEVNPSHQMKKNHKAQNPAVVTADKTTEATHPTSMATKKSKQQKKKQKVATPFNIDVLAKGSTMKALKSTPPHINESAVAAVTPAHQPHVAVATKKGDKGDESDSDDDSIVDDAFEATRRQRGRRRRGRQDTEKHILASRENEDEVVISKPSSKTQSNTANDAAEDSESNEPVNPNETAEETLERKKRDKREHDKRYCVGRKPVTDFEIGQRHSGRVVYVKPFGVFIDIGCHSDAFCHVSRLRDDFVDSAIDTFHEGDEVQARVVEIDRKQKRITVSLQSDARIEDERKSIDARKERRAKLSSKKRKFQPKATDDAGQEDEESIEASPTHPVKSLPVKLISKNVKELIPAVALKQTNTMPDQSAPFYDSGVASPGELKRARKLARRAARRAMNE